jgi:hypothetical protein
LTGERDWSVNDDWKRSVSEWKLVNWGSNESLNDEHHRSMNESCKGHIDGMVNDKDH